MLNPQAIAREVRRVKPATPRNPAPKTSQPRPLSFRSEIKQAWISVEDLPTLHDFALNEFEAEAGSIRCSLETQLKATTGDPDWQRRARLKLGKVKEFITATQRERGRRNRARSAVNRKLAKGECQTVAECKLNALRRLMADHLPQATAERLWGEAQRQGQAQFHEIKAALEAMDRLDEAQA